MCSPDIPDPGPAQIEAIQSQERLSNRALNLQDRVLNYMMDRQGNVDALQRETSQRQLAIAEQNAAIGQDYYDYSKQVFRPVEQSLVAQAMRESTPEFYDRYAQEAAARIESAQAGEQAQFEREMSSMGVNPNSGAYASTRRGLQLGQAAQRGAGMNDARDRAEALGWARRADVVGLGKGLAGAGNASYGIALQGNKDALQGANETSRTAGATLGTPNEYGQQAITAGMNAGTMANDIYRSQVQGASGDGSSMDGLWSAAGTALGYWASTGFAT